MSRGISIATGMAVAALAALSTASPASSESADSVFFRNANGDWSGSGAFINTKMRGTKFSCDLNGATQSAGKGFELNGKCRVGPFRYPMNAVISKSKGSYVGTFLNGAKGGNNWGFDIVSGKITGKKMEINLQAGISGSLVASMQKKNFMRITLNINHPEYGSVSVAFVDLVRKEETANADPSD